MIKFFRNIRLSLLEENKPGKYLAYASGEIVLVVIGILIALQLNNWNANRIAQEEKRELLVELNMEFKANKNVLLAFRKEEEKAMQSAEKLIELVGASKEELEQYDLDRLLFETFPSNELAFSDNAIISIVQSGRLSQLKDDRILDLLHQWNSLSEIRKVRLDKLDSWNNDHFLPFLLPYISFREMDKHANYSWAGTSKVKPDYYPLFQRVEFENLLDNSLWLHQKIIERVDESAVLIDQIIAESQ